MFWSTLLLVAAAFAQTANGAGDGTWGYFGSGGTSAWAAYDARCGGSSQSPIDITDSNTEVDESLIDSPFAFTNFDSTADRWTIKNYGKTIMATFDPSTVQRTMTGAGLPGTYNALQFHVHHGDENGDGSEHTFNGMQTALELHIVTMKTTYNNDFGTVIASGDPSGLAVLGMMFEIGDTANPALDAMLDARDAVVYAENTTEVASVSLDDLLPSNTSYFARYTGSLTTPPCSEVVMWTVFGETLSMSQDQYNRFLTFGSDDEGLEFQRDTFRPVMPLNGRTVKTTYAWHPTISSAAHVTVTLSVMLLTVLACFMH